MSPLEVLQLIGYSTAAALHLWVGALLLKRRSGLARLERVLMILAWALGVWHACNLVLALHPMLGLDAERWKTFLRVTNSVAVVNITVAYSLLLHAHLYLWANAKRRPLTPMERVRVYLCYLPCVFLPVALRSLWTEPYGPMYEKLAALLLPFALWAVYCLCLVAATDFLIARSTTSASERRLLKTLSAAFVGIAALIFSVYILRAGSGAGAGLYLQTLANLGSLVPTALLAYHIYRYRYLELIIKESLIIATVGGIVLVVYVFGVRTVGEWMTARFQLRPGMVESILILTLALFAAPLRNWLDRRFHRLFEREASLYRDVVTSIGASAGQYQQLPELLRYFEERIEAGLGLRRVRIVTPDEAARPRPDGAPAPTSDNEGGRVGIAEGGEVRQGRLLSRGVAGAEGNGASGLSVEVEGEAEGEKEVVLADGVRGDGVEGWEGELAALARGYGAEPIEGEAALRVRGFELAFALRREDRSVGLMLVDAPRDVLTHDVRSVLEILAGQVAVAVEDCRLVSENVQLERRLAHRERLAALGQMAATVAHEIKNPLSAIKSIVQVMREDERVSAEYARDLELIVGETDRLSRSVTQMLNFARSSPPPDAPHTLGALLRSVTQLTQTEAADRGVRVACGACDEELLLDGAAASALRDALSNIILNALHATPSGGTVRVEARQTQNGLAVSVSDEGPGIPESVRDKIWEPFFTTKQRGTGLGLAIVRKRLDEVGGAARLAPHEEGRGARFDLFVPLRAGGVRAPEGGGAHTADARR
jgi:signal transduction histidine kinase